MVVSTIFQSLKMIIRQKIIHNLPVIIEYIDIEEKIFGTNVSTLKGTTTRKIPKMAVEDFI